jgi:hypothetical protein
VTIFIAATDAAGHGMEWECDISSGHGGLPS